MVGTSRRVSLDDMSACASLRITAVFSFDPPELWYDCWATLRERRLASGDSAGFIVGCGTGRIGQMPSPIKAAVLGRIARQSSRPLVVRLGSGIVCFVLFRRFGFRLAFRFGFSAGRFLLSPWEATVWVFQIRGKFPKGFIPPGSSRQAGQSRSGASIPGWAGFSAGKPSAGFSAPSSVPASGVAWPDL